MKKIYFSVVILFITTVRLSSQTTVIPITSDSVLTNYLQGFGLTITNMSITAAPNSLAFFSGTSSISFGSGIILSTGRVDSVLINSPAASGFASYDNSSSGAGGDFDLNSISGGATYDACIIEFDCVPANANLLFDFAFASEEYPEFSAGTINDVFAILVSGPNPLGGNYTNQNFALIPGTTIPVSIQNVNNGNTNTGPCINCAYYFDNLADTTSPYDGYTVGLQGLVNVIPGQVYHFKIAVADNSDAIYDSGVLLKTYSFRTALVTSVNSINVLDDIALYPIPTNDKIYISSSTFKADKVDLFSIDGKKMDNIKLDESNSFIKIRGLSSGIYSIHLSNGSNTIIKKIIID
jgi:hypothetical protein